MICATCKKDIPSGSMWHCYRNGQDYCNSCIGDKIQLDFKELEKQLEQMKLLSVNGISVSLFIELQQRAIQGQRLIGLIDEEIAKYTNGFTLPDKEIKKLLQQLLQESSQIE